MLTDNFRTFFYVRLREESLEESAESPKKFNCFFLSIIEKVKCIKGADPHIQGVPLGGGPLSMQITCNLKNLCGDVRHVETRKPKIALIIHGVSIK